MAVSARAVRLAGAGLLLAIGATIACWHLQRQSTEAIFDRELARFRRSGPEGYLEDDGRYKALRQVVARGEPAARWLLPQLGSDDRAARFVAAAMLGTMVRQAYAKTQGSEQAGKISKRTLGSVVNALRSARIQASQTSLLAGMIGRDLRHVR